MRVPLDELYLTWLYSQVSHVKVKDPAKTHWTLMKQLYKKEFIWIIPNDDNRVEDGRDLRIEFIDSQDDLNDVDPDWMDMGCSMLEMLIALSRRFAFEVDGVPRDWFWHMLENVDLTKYTDKAWSRKSSKRVDDILDRIIWRTYDHDGHGGLFPLKNTSQDQRKIELWYQLSEYLMEQEF